MHVYTPCTFIILVIYLKAVLSTGQNDWPTWNLSLTRPYLLFITYLLFISPSLFIYFFLVGHGPGQKWRVHGPLVHVLSSLPGGQGFNLNS